MILGVLYPSKRPSVSEWQCLKKQMVFGGVTAFYVDLDFFQGSLLFNLKLPYTSEDLFFQDKKNEFLILINGSIYNKNELFSESTINDSISTPELILELFKKKGPGFVNSLNGDFAICIYSLITKEVYLFRDHIGIQPLFYTIINGTLYFSSDHLSLCRAFFNQETINMDPYLSSLKAIDHLAIINPKIKKLIPGHYLHFSLKGAQLIKYWYPEKNKYNYSLEYDEAIATLTTLVEDAVKIRSDKRFVAGTHLSGGLDSGLVATLARKNYLHQDSFKAFSYSPEGTAPKDVPWDERTILRDIAKLHDLDLVFCTLTKEDYLKYSKDFFNNRGYFSEQKTIEKAVEHGVNLIFTGWGGNEFISKEGTGIDSDLLFEFRLRKFFERNPLRKPGKIARTLYYYILLPALNILDHQLIKSYRRRRYYLKKGHKKHFRDTLKKYFFYRSRRERQLNSLYNYYIPELPEHWINWGFKNGIEYRFPLLDKRIIEYILQIPSHLMCRGETDRLLIRDLSKDLLPESVFKIPKYIDPVYFKSRELIIKDLGPSFIDEVDNWVDNPDLYFFDFEKLQKDIELYWKDPENKKLERMKPMLFYLKMLHEFTKTYRSLPESSQE